VRTNETAAKWPPATLATHGVKQHLWRDKGFATFTLVRFKSYLSAALIIFLSQRKAAVVSQKVAEGLRLDCGQCGPFAVFAVVKPQRTTAWTASV